MIEEHERAEARRQLALVQATQAGMAGGDAYRDFQTTCLEKINRNTKANLADRLYERALKNQAHG